MAADQAARQDEGLPLQQAWRQTRQSQAQACPKCSAPTTPDARFCIECGGSLMPNCPACAEPVLGGDFCQACGHWLLDAQCRFCYADVADGARFCEACGCNQSGIVCRRCQTTGFFDFCTGCGDPVSEKGQMLTQQALADPALEQLLQTVLQIQSQMNEAAAKAPPDLAPEKPAPRGPSRLIPREALQVLKEMDAAAKALQSLDHQRAAEAQARMRASAEEAARKAAEEQAEMSRQAERQEAMANGRTLSAQLSLSAQLRAAQKQVEALLKANEGVTYATPQEARCNFMQVRARLAALGTVPTGWRCVAYNSIHDTPNECANPAAGGTWLIG